MNCHGASYLHPLKSEIIYFHKVIGQVLLFALSTYCPVIQRCLYPLTSVYLCIHLCLVFAIPTLEKQRQAHLWGSLTVSRACVNSRPVREIMAEIDLSPPCAHTHTHGTHSETEGREYKRVHVRKPDVNMNTVAGCHSPNG